MLCVHSQRSHVGSVTKNQTPSPALPQVLCENKRPPSQLENSYFNVDFVLQEKISQSERAVLASGTAEAKPKERSAGK